MPSESHKHSKGQQALLEAIFADERAIKQQSELYALSFDQLMKELT